MICGFAYDYRYPDLLHSVNNLFKDFEYFGQVREMSAGILLLYFPWPLCPISNELPRTVLPKLFNNLSVQNQSRVMMYNLSSHYKKDISSHDCFASNETGSRSSDLEETSEIRCPTVSEDDVCSLLSTGLDLCNSVRPVDTDSGSLLVHLIFTKYVTINSSIFIGNVSFWRLLKLLFC